MGGYTIQITKRLLLSRCRSERIQKRTSVFRTNTSVQASASGPMIIETIVGWEAKEERIRDCSWLLWLETCEVKRTVSGTRCVKTVG